MRIFIQAANLFLIVTTMAAAAHAADVENPPVFKASAVLGRAVQGPGYEIASKVPSDGYLRLYDVETPWGPLNVQGDQMLQMRLKEIQAVNAMDQTQNSKEFGDALVKAGLKPVEFAGKLVTDPVDTVKNTVKGVGQLFSGIGAGIRNAGKTPDNVVSSVTGAAKQRRLIAYNYGVDPYTDLPPLKEKLDDLSRAAAAGGLAVTGAFILIPGAAGTIISNVATAGTLNQMVRDYSAAQLMDMNRAALKKMGSKPSVVEALLANRNYTPTDVTAMTGALGTMGRLINLDVLISQAAGATSRDGAYFMRRGVEMMAAYQQRTGDIGGFVALGAVPMPMATAKSGGLVGLLPVDALSWTATTSQAFTAVSRAATGAAIGGPKMLVITGTATPLAQKQLLALGWTLQQKAPN